MNVNVLLDNCTGCECCFNVCPKKAINMVADNEGFFYPKIDNNLCINCNLCYEKCPQNIDNSIKKNQSYFGFSKYSEVLSCASGGVCTFLSKKIIDLGGYVCGCVYDDNFNVLHLVTNKKEELEKMKSSKYVQSRVGDIYSVIKNLLLDKIVLFIGTPCQVAGIKSFVGNNINLYTIDIVCHGVPSPLLFKNYIAYLEQKYKSKLISYNFRFKNKGYWSQTVRYSFKNGKVKISEREYDKFDLDYKKRVNYRESCYKCKYSTIENRVGNITVGDFWGLNHNDPNYDRRGVSSIIVNDEKGKELLDFINEDLLFKVNRDSVLLKQDALCCPTVRPKERDNYYKELDDDFFWKKKQPRKPLKIYFLSLVPVFVKKFIKKVLKIIKK